MNEGIRIHWLKCEYVLINKGDVYEKAISDFIISVVFNR